MDFVSGLEKACCAAHSSPFYSDSSVGLLGQQTPHQGQFPPARGPEAMLGVGQLGTSSIAGHASCNPVSLSQLKTGQLPLWGWNFRGKKNTAQPTGCAGVGSPSTPAILRGCMSISFRVSSKLKFRELAPSPSLVPQGTVHHEKRWQKSLEKCPELVRP